MTVPRERTVRSPDGTKIAAVTIGSGEPLVMVHGAWNWGEQWLGVAEELAESHTCWVMDRRARGSSGDGDDYSFDREIEDVASVLDAAGRDASLLGHSSGAIYALETARRRGVGRLVVYEPPFLWAEQGDPTDIVDRTRALVDAGQAEEAAELFFREEGRVDEETPCVLEDAAGVGDDGRSGTDLYPGVGCHPRCRVERRAVRGVVDADVATRW